MAEVKVAKRRHSAKLLAMIGSTFGRLTVLADAGIRGAGYGSRYVLCRCACGVEKEIKASAVTGGVTVSCGCAQRDATRKHGAEGTPEYKVWGHIKERCLNNRLKCYKNYGGRGISIHPAWASDFAAFLDHVGLRPTPQHSIDRMDNSLGYVPGNVRWATRFEQARNKRNNRIIEYDGRAQCLQEWANEFGIRNSALTKRLDVWNWPVELALTKPVEPRKPRVAR